MSEKQQTISNLKRLRSICEEQQKAEFVDALDEALKALGNDQEQGDQGDGLRLSDSASEMLDQLTAQVRDTTLTPTYRTAAAARLVRLGGGGR